MMPKCTDQHEIFMRSVDMFEMALNGNTWKAIGIKYNVSRSRAPQIVAKLKRQMCHPSRLKEPFPEGYEHYIGYGHNIDNARAHKDFWLRQIALFKIEKNL